MLIYSGTKREFDTDVISDNIANKIKKSFCEYNLYESANEFVSWENSLKCMHNVLSTKDFSDDLQIAVEYQIPQTAKRVDFLIAGANDIDCNNVVVIELKQWERANKTISDGIITTYVADKIRSVTHPSYQAYSYAETIKNFNEYVQNKNIGLYPCAYLHNFKKQFLEELTDPIYKKILDLAPIYIHNEEEKLRNFIKKFITKPSKTNILFQIDNGRIRPSKALQDTIASMIKGNQEFLMIDEQKCIYERIKNIINESNKEENKNKKYTIIVEGGPGTGKSVVAIKLLADLISEKRLLVSYVTKNSAPRNVYFSKLKQGNCLNNYVKTLFKGSGIFTDMEQLRNEFDCLIVDEAHRLNQKSGMFKNKGENQIKEIINASRVSVFFIDEDQLVTSSDIGSISEIRKQAKDLNSIICNDVYHEENFKLTSQFRCNGSDGYLAFLDDVLGIRSTANYDGFDKEYNIKIFDNPSQMREELRMLNNKDNSNKTRMVAGYCYDWITKNSNDNSVYDIELKPNFRAKWNFSNTDTWAIDENSFDQIGCIHTSQGLEFDYVGVIIGLDLRYDEENKKVITDPSKRAKSDKSLWGLKKNVNYLKISDKIIRNTYKTLLTRGQKGCYIYCEDESLKKYLKKRLSIKYFQQEE